MKENKDSCGEAFIFSFSDNRVLPGMKNHVEVLAGEGVTNVKISTVLKWPIKEVERFAPIEA